jgi:hypothetical protein
VTAARSLRARILAALDGLDGLAPPALLKRRRERLRGLGTDHGGTAVPTAAVPSGAAS